MSPVNAPRARLLVNGTAFPPPLTVKVTHTNYFHASTFEAEFAMNMIGPATLDTLLQPQNITVEVQMEQEIAGQVSWTSVLLGVLDRDVLHYDDGTLSLSGRDNTALLIDNKTEAAYPNNTSSEVATLLAQRHGLTPDVQTTRTLIGVDYNENHDTIKLGSNSKARSEWDLITSLAKEEGFSAWVTGTTLHFRPLPASSTDAWVAQWAMPTVAGDVATYPASNVWDRQVTHNRAVAKDIRVEVLSWHRGERRSNKATSQPRGKTASAGSASGSTGNTYTYTFPNLTPAQAQAKADELYDALVRHEVEIAFTANADLTLDPRRQVALGGATGVLAQAFYVDEVAFSLSPDAGFLMAVQAKNYPEAGGSTL